MKTSKRSNVPKTKTKNKGIYKWFIGQKRYRVVICGFSRSGESMTVGYFHNYDDAREAYFQAHLKQYNFLPDAALYEAF